VTPPPPAATAQAQAAPRTVPRSPADVSSAVRAAPGLREASAAQIGRLEELLGQGTCATDALRTVFGSINRQTLVSLIRDLGGC
jgi:hypothetical protein